MQCTAILNPPILYTAPYYKAQKRFAGIAPSEITVFDKAIESENSTIVVYEADHISQEKLVNLISKSQMKNNRLILLKNVNDSHKSSPIKTMAQQGKIPLYRVKEKLRRLNVFSKDADILSNKKSFEKYRDAVYALNGCKCDAPINLAISYSRKYKLPIYVDNDDEVDAIKSISKDVSVFSVMKPKVMNTHILYLPNSNRDNENARKRLVRASQLALCSIIVITDSQEN